MDDDSLENRRKWMGCGRRNKPKGKKLVGVIGELYCLREKLEKKYKKRDEARQRILKLDKLYHNEV